MNETEAVVDHGVTSTVAQIATEPASTQCKMKRPRGFALLPRERLKEISRKGGQAVPGEKRMFALNKDFAATCGRKGGKAVPANKRIFSRDRNVASEAGSKGVEVRRSSKAERDE